LISLLADLVPFVHRLAAVAGRLLGSAAEQEQLGSAGLAPEDGARIRGCIDRLLEGSTPWSM
jgi:hypothetical protein